MILGDEPLIFKVVLSQLASILKIFTRFFISLVKKKKKERKKAEAMVGNGWTLNRAKKLCFIHPSIPYLQSKRSTKQTTPTTLPRRWESRGQTRK
jgi:CMP-2-keto-3-deoxyoctulosonic acid synthetase